MTIKGKDLLEKIKDKQYSKDVIEALEEYEITAPQSILDLERAKLRTRVLNTELAIKKWIKEHDNVELDWENNRQYKYYLRYYCENRLININCFTTVKLANTIYFSSRVKAEQCIRDIGKERIIEWLKWEDTDQ